MVMLSGLDANQFLEAYIEDCVEIGGGWNRPGKARQSTISITA